MHDYNAVKIYTDGSAKPNPGKGGIGMVVEYPDSMNLDNAELSEGYVLTTNNRMELKAVIGALEWLQGEMKMKRFTRAIIITDSEYVYANHGNAQYWKSNGWRTKDGKPYENEDLWDAFLKERQKTKVRHDVVWAKGKNSEVLCRVDALAKRGAGNPTKTDHGFRSGKFTATRTAGGRAATQFPARGQEVLIRVYRKSLYGRNAEQIYKVAFDLYDEDVKSYIGKYFAYLGQNRPDLKRNNCYRVTFNDNPAFAQILKAVAVEYLKGSP